MHFKISFISRNLPIKHFFDIHIENVYFTYFPQKLRYTNIQKISLQTQLKLIL